MLQKISSFLLYPVLKYKRIITVTPPPKCIICLAPHTSNMDFFIGLLYSWSENMHCRFLMKKEWFFWPLGKLFKKLGGTPVYRNTQTNMTDTLAQMALNSKSFKLCVTPEGTRSLNAEWKKGFYYIALKAQIPILLYGLDYKKKEIVCTKSIIPNGDIEKQFDEIKSYYKDFTGRHPELFTTGN